MAKINPPNQPLASLTKLELERFLAVCTLHFPSFLRYVFHLAAPGSDYSLYWHIDLISEYLLACERKEITRLIINVPPRSLKSLTCSIAYPAWLLGHGRSKTDHIALPILYRCPKRFPLAAATLCSLLGTTHCFPRQRSLTIRTPRRTSRLRTWGIAMQPV